MKIATFNINNINKRLGNLLAWLARAQPDVVCLQELKADQGAFPVDALRSLDYRAVWQGERSWNGVAILGNPQPGPKFNYKLAWFERLKTHAGFPIVASA